MNPVVLVTGANGFVGTALVRRLSAAGLSVREAVRDTPERREKEWVSVGEINGATRWDDALEKVRTVVHLAGRVHVMRDMAANPWAAFRQCNVAGTRRLAEQAARLGVRRLVFVSSIKVNGEHTEPGRFFSEQDVPAPVDAYGVSKWEAEQALWEVAKNTGLEVVIVRPPLVYGPGVKGNFARLVESVRRGVPLPFATVRNRRSLVGVDNLADLLARCTEHPRAANQTFLVSDGEDLSISELIRRLARVMDRPARLIPMPPGLMLAGARLLGRVAEIERLIGCLQVDMSHACRTLDWSPPVDVEKGLARMVVSL